MKEVTLNVSVSRIEQITRERTRKNLWRQPAKAKRIKKVRNNGSWFIGVRQIAKWWTIVTSIQSYTCAANRHAKFRSNRRFKPGD